MIKHTSKFLALATVAGLAMVSANPAFAGRKTGSWKYSPDQIYQYQRAQDRAAWEQQRYYRGGPGVGFGVYAGPRYAYPPRYSYQPRYESDDW